MKNTIKYWVACIMLAALFTLPLFAQVVSGPDAAPATTPKTNIGLMLIPIIVPIVIAVAKMFIPKLPGWTLPILAPLLGAIADYLMTGTFGQGTIMGAIAGSAGVGLREIADQVQKANATPAVNSPPK